MVGKGYGRDLGMGRRVKVVIRIVVDSEGKSKGRTGVAERGLCKEKENGLWGAEGVSDAGGRLGLRREGGRVEGNGSKLVRGLESLNSRSGR